MVVAINIWTFEDYRCKRKDEQLRSEYYYPKSPDRLFVFDREDIIGVMELGQWGGGRLSRMAVAVLDPGLRYVWSYRGGHAPPSKMAGV
jgi:hypothetical protein